MRTTTSVVLVFACVALLACGGPAYAAQNEDLVVLVDTSESMFPYFDDLMNYLVQDLLTSRLHKGDTFHLISFSSLPEVEITLEVNSDEAARQAFSRVLLLHALGRYTDLVAAMQFLYKYAKELPETNPKHVIIITDGVHDPPPGSPNTGSPATSLAALLATAQAMRSEGWSFNILKVPPVPAPEDQGAKSYLGDIASTLGVPVVPYPVRDKRSVTGVTTGYPTLYFPGAIGQVGNRFAAPFRVKNWKPEPIIISLSSVQSEGTELLDKKVTVNVPANGEAPLAVPLKLPISYPKGVHNATVRLVFDDDPRISPTEGTISFSYTGKGGLPIPRLTFLYVLYILLALAAIYLLVRLFLYMRKKLAEAPLSGLARAHGSIPSAAEEPEPSRTAAGASAHARAVARVDRTAVRAVPSPASAPARVARAAAAGGSSASRRAAKVSLMGTAAARTPIRGQVSLMEARPATVGRVARPTVSSITRALPRRPLQQSSLPPLIEMRVDQQNHRVGFRNVHRIPVGAAKSIGGRFSAYLVFLVPMPGGIAEIRNVDGRYVFIPLRRECFPGLDGPIEDCLGREIPFITSKGRVQVLHFREWVSPLDEINGILHQARSPMN